MSLFKKGPYTGPVCYADGWHWSVKNNQPHKKLFLDDNGTFVFAKKGHPDWHGRNHAQFVDLLRSDV